jgi:hypothetical protein
MLPSSSLTTLPATFPDMDALLLVLEAVAGGQQADAKGDRADNSPSSKTNPPMLTASAWPKSHKRSLFSTITSSEIDIQTSDIRRLDDITRYYLDVRQRGR